MTAVSASAADNPSAEEGRRAFNAGVILLQDPDGARYEEAYTQFRKAFELTKNWKVLGNLGLCALKLERDGEAISAYEKYLSQGGKDIDSNERSQVERDLAALKAQVATVNLELYATSGSIVDQREKPDGSKVGNEYPITANAMQLGLHAGRHVLRVVAKDGEARWETTLEAGSVGSHRFELSKAPAPGTSAPSPSALSATAPSPSAPSSSRKTLAYVAGGVGIVGLGVGTVFGLRTFSKKSDRDAACPGGICTSQAGIDLDSQARTAARTSTIGFGVGLVGLGVGTYLLLSAPKTRSDLGLWISPDVGATSEGVQMGGAF
jgi:hypothetical protein